MATRPEVNWTPLAAVSKTRRVPAAVPSVFQTSCVVPV
ncbi:unannotated protein [freshwater metagenome]|uniref:Unannotated protein n=1 Tax=freshwater metagenome TaxID=449393 RepID=A0A6J7FFN5_9ZZZZ